MIVHHGHRFSDMSARFIVLSIVSIRPARTGATQLAILSQPYCVRPAFIRLARDLPAIDELARSHGVTLLANR